MSTTSASPSARCTSASAWPTRRRATLRALDLAAVRAAPGVVAVLTAADIPGKNDIAPVFADEPLFADRKSCFTARPCSPSSPRTRDEARRAARLAKIDIEEAKPAITVDDAIADRRPRAARLRIRPRRRRGARSPAAPHRLEGHVRASAARSISISKARPRSRFPARATR